MTRPPNRRAQLARILWQLSLDREIRHEPVALADGVIVVQSRARQCQLRRIDLAEGATMWTSELPSRAAAAPARTGQLIAVPMINGAIAAHQLSDGAPINVDWTPLGQVLNPPIAARAGRIFARAGHDVGAVLGAFAPSQNRPLWVRSDPLAGGERAQFRMTSGVLVVAGVRDGNELFVCGLDPGAGTELWTYTEPECGLNDLWAIGGAVDVVTDSHGVIGLDPQTGTVRTKRFQTFPLGPAVATGEHLITLMEGHMGPVLLCFDSISQKMIGRVNRALDSMVSAHPGEALVLMKGGPPVLYAIPDLDEIDMPESDALGTPRFAAWARDILYVVSDEGRTLSAIDLKVDANHDC